MDNKEKALIKAATSIGANTAGTVHITYFYYNVLPAERKVKMLDVVIKNEKLIGSINPRYDMTIKQMIILKENYPDAFQLMKAAFRFGYLQGGKEKEAEMKRSPEQIKSMGDRKSSITSTVYKLRHKFALETVDMVAKLIRNYYDDREYVKMSNREKQQVLIIREVLELEKEENIERVSNLIRFLSRKEESVV